MNEQWFKYYPPSHIPDKMDSFHIKMNEFNLKPYWSPNRDNGFFQNLAATIRISFMW